jgi:hypothetical protein
MYGKIQSCGDFPLLARVIFVTFLAYFFGGGGLVLRLFVGF